MFATWILCLFLLMIAPYLTLEAAFCARRSARRLARAAVIAPSFPWLLRKRGTTPSGFAANAT